MSEENKKAIIVNKVPKIYQDNSLELPLDVSLPVDSEIEIAEVEENNAVKVILPDSSIGYIHGDEELHIIQPSWTINETKVYNSPDELATPQIILKKGQEFELLNFVEDSDNEWFRIRLPGNQIGYIRGGVEVITEDSLIEAIGELIGEDTSEEKIVRNFTKQGVPEEKVRGYYHEINRLAAEYIESPEVRKELAGQFSKRIFYGILWVIGGTIASVASYEAASAGGGMYFVFYGAIIWGVIDIIRGFVGWMKYS